MSFPIANSHRRKVAFARRTKSTLPGRQHQDQHFSSLNHSYAEQDRATQSSHLTPRSDLDHARSEVHLDRSTNLTENSNPAAAPPTTLNISAASYLLPILANRKPTTQSQPAPTSVLTKRRATKASPLPPSAMEEDENYDPNPEGKYTIPPHHLSPKSPADDLKTESSMLQTQTEEECLPYLRGNNYVSERNNKGIPKLNRAEHGEFAHRTLQQMSKRFVGYDASRPWLLYWAFTAMTLLGDDPGVYEERAIGQVVAAQNPDGGIGGGYGMLSHVAPTYAAMLALAQAGDKGLDTLDRKAMWEWLGTLKQADGGFSVAEGAEIDVRGAYCSMTIISILNLPRELPPDAPARQAGLATFTDKLEDWLGRCQTYQGGIAASPGNEAHGAYAFCALACACILGVPSEIIPRIFDLPRLIEWLSARQSQPEGGYSGRTNKLVDGCYSHWVGGCWPLIEAALGIDGKKGDGLFSREGLIRYVLCCCQEEEGGGLRDKPSKGPDGYHTCYILSGLSAAQHHVVYTPNAEEDPVSGFPYCWQVPEEGSLWQGVKDLELHQESILNAIHPVFVISFEAVDRVRRWAVGKKGF